MRPTRSIFAPAAAKTIARVRERQRDPLHHRAGDVGARRRLAHAEQNAARVRIVERRPLAAEIGQKEKRAGAGIIRRRLTLERVRGRAEKPPGESERAGAVEHRRHRVPAVWQRMGESVHELLRRAHVSVGRDDELRRGSERDEGFARRDGAQAHRANGCVAAAGREQNAARQAKRVRGLRPDPAGRRRSFEQGRRPGEIRVARVERFRRPVSPGLVEKPGPRRVAHVRRPFAAELEAQIVLRRQERVDETAMVRLVPRDPFELRPGEAGHRLHADDLGQVRIVARQFVRLDEKRVRRCAGSRGGSACQRDREAPRHASGPRSRSLSARPAPCPRYF